MKRLALAFIAATGLAATAARADRVDFRGSIQIGGPVYAAPVGGYYGSCAPVPVAPQYYVPQGSWRDVAVPVWVPGRWIMSRDAWGRHVRLWEPGHNEYRRERVWVDAYGRSGRHHGPRWNG